MTLPPDFFKGLPASLQADYPLWVDSLALPAPISIRWNTHKISKYHLSPAALLNDSPLNQHINDSNLKESKGVSWHPQGQYLTHRPIFTLDPLWHSGIYYVQEASSMLVGLALPAYPVRTALDFCAAPGGKTTLLSTCLPADCLLIANETIANRATILRQNITRWGNPNIWVTKADPEKFTPLHNFFDFVLVDAPCSGEGLWRKTPEAVQEWSLDTVRLCASRQKRILAASAPLIRAGGRLVYSTCTYNTLENDANVIAFLENNPSFRSVPLAASMQQPTEWEKWGIIAENIGNAQLGDVFVYRCFPHKVAGEGFFMAVFEKEGEPEEFTMPSISNKKKTSAAKSTSQKINTDKLQTLKQYPYLLDFVQQEGQTVVFKETTTEKQIMLFDPQHIATAQYITQYLPLIQAGVYAGDLKGKDFIPSHDLALSAWLKTEMPAINLAYTEAIAYLRLDNFIPADMPSRNAIYLIKYQNIPLGWVKWLGNRMNNYLPKSWRILMDA